MATISLSDMTRREALVAELATQVKNPPARVGDVASDPALAKLRQLGTQLWMDTGDLEAARKLWRQEFSALTTNNTLANQVVQTGIMDEDIKEAARRIRDVEPGVTPDDLVMDIGFVINCHIALRLVSAFDAFVSVELHPSIAHDIEKTVRYAQRYYAVHPERFIVKIPMTPEGFCAVARARAEGIPINYTLGFSARQNYLATLLSKPNYCNVFLGRLNSVVADNHLGDGRFVGEKATLASQRVVRELREHHPDIPTRQIAASMRSGEQLLTLAGVDVYTAPPKAVEEFYAAHPRPESIESCLNKDYEVHLNPGADAETHRQLELLWTVDDAFKAFAKELAARGGVHLTGNDLRQADRDHGTRLFSNFTSEEQQAIREKGKIPDFARWKVRASLDDLMTEAALQSFIVDQEALDARIRKLIAEA
ncbi:transaldolase family protein [Chthonomonas calidirosea]|uniref:transaldolase family protein n=1 Tax=Chthonomonas calidirosea TaxID=454171 RepID=UPI0006EC921C|nr:transaldolase family protein [Chthonomonas calidirosea]CEK14506.1 transaldolase [Chthonomonas calidirosea]